MPWNITIRTGGKVQRATFDALNEALAHVETEARAAATRAPNAPVDAKIRTFTPAQQVIARVELAGPERMLPKVRIGLDVHGDGSVDAFLGRVKRRMIEQRKKETPYAALRRVLSDEGLLQNQG